MKGFPEHLSALLQREAYPHPVRNIQLVETHVSWVLLTGELAYKIKRPVAFPFVDLRSAERRAHFCREELRLNRRFAPALYLDVCAITESAGRARVGGDGQVIEHAVKMVQFPRAHELDRLLAADGVAVAELERFGSDMADIHATLPVAADTDSWGQPEKLRELVLSNLRECTAASRVFDAADVIVTLGESLRGLFDERWKRFSARRMHGNVRECHGDLHARNVVRRDGNLVAFDCMEFEPAFRWIDVAQEVAFLTMDLERYGRAHHAQAFLTGYLARNGDYDACRVLDFYKAHMALVRAKVAALEIADANETLEIEPARSQFNRYVDVARGALAVKRPRLILFSGYSGSGKTWLARQLAPRLGAIHLRSDIERKRLAGLSAQARSRSDLAAGLYSSERTDQAYTRLAECAEAALSGGFTALVDATFLRQAERAKLLDLAHRLRLRPLMIRCHAPVDVLRARILHRHAQGTDPSEADPAVLSWQLAHAEPLGEQERFELVDIDVSRPGESEAALLRIAQSQA